MTNRRLILSSLALATLLPALAAAQAPAADHEAMMKRVLEAVKARSYEDFLADADEQVKSGITRQMFDGVAGQLAPRLRQGYKTAYLGKLRQQGHLTHLWRMELADGKDDVLVRLSVKGGKIGGVFFQ